VAVTLLAPPLGVVEVGEEALRRGIVEPARPQAGERVVTGH
jgi:hypothetical protein